MAKIILTISTSRSLTGVPIRDGIAKDWKKATAEVADKFDNQGFDVDLEDVPNTLDGLRSLLQGHHWDGVIVGWCLRGYKERTALFEQIVHVCFEAKARRPEIKIMFCTGPDDLYATTMRHFG